MNLRKVTVHGVVVVLGALFTLPISTYGQFAFYSDKDLGVGM